MHLAVVGVCPESLGLAAAAVSAGHRVTWYAAEDEREAALAALETAGAASAEFEPYETWESVLDSPTLDGVVLARASAGEEDLRSDQWRRLAQAGSRMIVVHPVVPSLLVYLEVDMLARESGAAILPYWPDAFSEEAREVERLALGPLYGVGTPPYEQFRFQRFLDDRSPPRVVHWFSRDAAMLDLVAGPFTAIAAVGPDDSDAAYASLAVHLYGPSGVPVRWEVARAQTAEEGVLTADGVGDALELTFAGVHGGSGATSGPRSAREVHLAELGVTGADGGSGAKSGPRSAREDHLALACLQTFERVIDQPASSIEPWHGCVRAMELADSIEISLRRGRKIDVHYRQMSEETSYKGLMSAVGCGLLLLAPVVLMVAGMVNAVFGWRLTRFWYVPVLVILSAFLLLQLFARIMARPPDSGVQRESDGKVGISE